MPMYPQSRFSSFGTSQTSEKHRDKTWHLVLIIINLYYVLQRTDLLVVTVQCVRVGGVPTATSGFAFDDVDSVVTTLVAL